MNSYLVSNILKQIAVVFMLFFIILPKSYADEQSENKTIDWHFKIQVGGGALQTDKKLVDAGNKFASGNKHNSQLKSSYYLNAQAGGDYKFNSGLHIAPYGDYATMKEYQGASVTTMYGAGVELARPAILLGKLLKINYGAEVHMSMFDFMKIPNPDKSSDSASSSSSDSSKKNQMVSYSGFGYRLDAGLSYNHYSISTFYLHNNYDYVEVNTNTKEYDDIINKAFPKTIQSSMIGVALGFNW